MVNMGVRVPMDGANRDAEFMVHLLWDWFDGGFFEGWRVSAEDSSRAEEPESPRNGICLIGTRLALNLGC